MTLMECPKCGLPQPPAEECVRCGVIVRKAHGGPLRPLRSAPDIATPPPSGRGTSWIAAILLLIGTSAGLVLFARARQTRALSTPVVAPDARPARHGVEPEPTHGTFVERGVPVATPTYPPLTPSEEPAVSVAPPPMAAGPVAAPVSPWYEGAEGYRQANLERERYGRPMAVYFHTDWCGWCRKMESEILSASETNGYLDEITKVRINPERGKEEAALARQYGVRGFPSFFIVPASGGSGRKVHPFSANHAMSPAEFVAACRGAV